MVQKSRRAVSQVQENLIKSLMTVSRVTSFILQAHMGNYISQNNAAKAGQGVRKIKGEWTRNAVISTRKKFLAVNEGCVAMFRPTFIKVLLKGEHLSTPLWVQNNVRMYTGYCY